jgi:hypothetical protein
MSFDLDSQVLDVAHTPSHLSKDLNRFLASSAKQEVRLAWAQRADHSPELELERVRLEQDKEVLLAFINNKKLTKKSLSFLLKSNNKSISLLAGLSKRATRKNCLEMLTNITSPVFKKYISLNISHLAVLPLNPTGEEILIKYTEIKYLHSLFFNSSIEEIALKRIFSINFNNSKGERNLMYSLLFLAKNDLLTDGTIQKLIQKYPHPFLLLLTASSDYSSRTSFEKSRAYIAQIVKYLPLEKTLPMLPFLDSIPFQEIYGSKVITEKDISTLLKLYPTSVYELLESNPQSSLSLKDVLYILSYVLSDSKANKVLDLQSIFKLPMDSNIVDFYQEIVDNNCFKNKRLARYIVESKDCPLSIALQIDAGVSISGYHKQLELIEYMFRGLNYRDFEAFRVMAREFDGTINELMNIVRNFGFYE